MGSIWPFLLTISYTVSEKEYGATGGDTGDTGDMGDMNDTGEIGDGVDYRGDR